jgi:hypothetical protein
MSKSNFPLETLYFPIDVAPLHEQSCRDQYTNRRLVKLGLAVMVLDGKDRMLVLEHEARDREFGQRAVGPSMETFRYINGCGENKAESPIAAWIRSLDEELPNSSFVSPQDRLSQADVYVARDSRIETGQWSLGIDEETNLDLYACAVSLCIRSSNPEALLPDKRSEEVLCASFQPIEKVLTADNPRPGFIQWMERMSGSFCSDNTKLQQIEFEHDLPQTGLDVRFDVVGRNSIAMNSMRSSVPMATNGDSIIFKRDTVLRSQGGV